MNLLSSIGDYSSSPAPLNRPGNVQRKAGSSPSRLLCGDKSDPAFTGKTTFLSVSWQFNNQTRQEAPLGHRAARGAMTGQRICINRSIRFRGLRIHEVLA